jgi:ribosomal peptide maturation radical SAM protein 1
VSIAHGGIILVAPPFQSVTRPALGVSQLKANLIRQGFPTEIVYLNLRFAELIGLDTFERISEQESGHLFGEFVFSCVLFERSETDLERFARQILCDGSGPQFPRWTMDEDVLQTLRRCVNEAIRFCKDSLETILARNPWLVGFSSSFQQNCSSLALIKRIKQARPEILTIMGGANCEAEMGEELFARFPEIDYIGSGECDHSFPALAQSLRDGHNGRNIPGILARTDTRIPALSGVLKSEDLDQLPYPDFDDFFAQLASNDFADRIVPGLIMETSRGCWWGAKQHCTFCGLNGQGMVYRSKSAARAIAEMRALVKQYQVPRIEVVDNILDMKYFKSVLPQLAADPVGDLFFETKSNLSRDQVRMLTRSRIKWIQPGIESLSDRTLELMRKGSTMLQNIQLLKWSTECGIHVGWNYLFGFPGEDDKEVAEIVRLAASVNHLEPPTGASVLHLDRFSPYFENPDRYGLQPLWPAKPYSHVYPFPMESLKRIAYFFDSAVFVNKSKSETFKNLQDATSDWRDAYARSHLLAIPSKSSLVIIDTRPCRQRLWRRLTGISRSLYQLCDTAHNLPTILENLGSGFDQNEVQSALDTLVRFRLMINVNGRYLSLATDPRGEYKRFLSIFPGGMIKELKASQKLGRSLAALIHNKVALKDFCPALIHTASSVWKRFTSTLLARALSVLVALIDNRAESNQLPQ